MLNEQILNCMYGRRAPDTLRGSIAGGSYDAVLEHHRAVVLLAEQRLFGSAFALIRPMLDGCLHGLWGIYLADDSELERFNIGRLTCPDSERTIKRLKSKDDGDMAVTLQRIHDEFWKPLSSYVHGGIEQVARRNAVEFIGSNYTSEEVTEILTVANAMALLAIMEIASISGDPTFINEINHISSSFVGNQCQY